MQRHTIPFCASRTARLLASAAAISCISAASTAVQADVLTPYTADYDFSIEGKYNGSAKRSLRKEGKHWRYVFSASVPVVAKATQDTLFSYQATGTQNFLPLTHQTNYKIFVINRQTSLLFDYAKNQLKTTHRGKSKDYPLQTMALDELTLEMQIRKDLSDNNIKKNYRIQAKKAYVMCHLSMKAK